jgi:hypothetical protein
VVASVILAEAEGRGVSIDVVQEEHFHSQAIERFAQPLEIAGHMSLPSLTGGEDDEPGVSFNGRTEFRSEVKAYGLRC